MTTKTKLAAVLIAALAIFSAADSSPARAQDAQVATATHIVSHIEVAPAASYAAVALLRKLREASLHEPGNASFVVLQRIGQPQHFLILESWRDAKEIDAIEKKRMSAPQAHTPDRL